LAKAIYGSVHLTHDTPSPTGPLTLVGPTSDVRSMTGLLEGQFLQVFSVLSSAAEARSAKIEAILC
jgi:hypothetical protein